jgi:hypothetical protein
MGADEGITKSWMRSIVERTKRESNGEEWTWQPRLRVSHS